MIRVDEVKILSSFAEIARPIILKYFREDSCIASSLIALRVFRYFGIHARECPSYCQVWNAATVEQVERQGKWPETEEELEDWVDKYNVFGTGIVPGIDLPGGWCGHLVVATKKHLIDASFSQFSRPNKGLDVPDVAVLQLQPNEFFHEEMKRIHEEGWIVIYQYAPKNRRYLKSPDWQARWRTDLPTEEIIRVMEKEL